MKQKGFSLIELMVSLSIMSFILVLASPSFVAWIANLKSKNVTESVQYAILQTKTEAMKTNSRVRVEIQNDTSWQIIRESDGAIINGKVSGEAQNTLQINTEPNNANSITFNGLGNVVENSDGSDTVNNIRIVNSLDYNSKKNFRITVLNSGMVEVCDEEKTNPQHHMFCN